MDLCHENCKGYFIKVLKVNFMDRILGRDLNEKLDSFCHVECLKSLNLKNLKRGGRWGFVSLFGFAEIVSSMIAFFSFLMNIYCFKFYIGKKLDRSPLKKLYLIQNYICNFTFFSSFLYHARETTFTRNADYYSAFAGIVIGLIVSINRLIHIYKPSVTDRIRNLTLKIGFYYFIMHVVKMSHDFDYSYNKISCGIMFVASCISNIIIFFHLRDHEDSINMIYSIALLLLAGFIEILDFSPILYLLDSHALWHAFMALATPYYFKFIACDIDRQ